MNSTNIRKSNFELLRIVCMILIVAHHFSIHGQYSSNIPLFNQAIIDFLVIGGKIGVNVYVLISGYFMINSNFNIKKLIKILIQVFFYNVIFYLIFLCLNRVDFNRETLLTALFPISTNQYWFTTCYVILIILSPFINLCLKNCTHKQHLSLIGILIYFQIIVEYVFETTVFLEIGWFILLYVIAVYIRLYPNKIFENKASIPTFVISFLLIATFSICFDSSLWEMKTIVCLICSISMFCVFKNINIKNNKFLNLIVSTTFGIYLIHDNYYIRNVIWYKILKVNIHANYSHFILFSILCIIIVFIVCCLIDLLRQLLFKALKKKA